MDAFFASVEVLDDPALAGKPVIVGGSGARGVVASCTYEARAYGVRSAMPSARARRLCPDAVFVDGHYSRYAEVSGRLHEVLRSVTPLVEPIGLDEAFLDVSGARRLLGLPEGIARGIRARVSAEMSLECCIGVGRSKLIAKLASRAAKPRADRRGKQPGRGVVVVMPEDELTFLHPMPVEALWGVGPATADRLHALGVRTVGELAALPPDTVVRRFGQAHGHQLVALARADDPSPVVPDRPTKSIGQEETFRRDIHDGEDLRRHAARMAEAVAGQLRKGEQVARTITVKVRFGDFSTITRSHTLPFAVDTAPAIAAVAGALLEAVDPAPGVRLLGVSASGLQRDDVSHQLAFDLASALDRVGPGGEGAAGSVAGVGAVAEGPPAAGDPRAARLQASWQDVTAAVDAIRRRFGTDSVGAASMVGDSGVTVPRQREAPWGPSAEEPPD
jgi:DNA polymerase-4